MKRLNEIRVPVIILKRYEFFLNIIKKIGHFVKEAVWNFFMILKNNYKLLLAVAIMFSVPFLIRSVIWVNSTPKTEIVIENQDDIVLRGEKLLKETKALEKKLAAKTPRSFYVIINSASNEFSLYKGMELIQKDKCSTGSYVLLKNGDEKQWMFKTPKGEFRIQGKVTSPVWRKPDWAFIEEGLPVPVSNHYSRFESGVLGDYALSLGDGYLIHGTLYQRFLGLPVTHGCIRLGDANLKLVYNSLSVGSKVYIY